MKRLALITLSVLMTAGLTACATTTPYGPADSQQALGYRDYPIESNRYRVTYRANSTEAANDFALRRAAELTLANGYDWFDVVSRSEDRETTSRSGSGVTIGGSTGSGGGVALGGGIGINLGSGSTGKSAVSIEVLMGSGERPDRPSTYDARSVVANIAR